MTVLPARRTALVLATGALLLAGVSACGSSSNSTSASDPGASPAAAGSAVASAGGSNGGATPTPVAAATGSPLAGAAPASIAIDSPADGTSVSGNLSVSGTANSPEANVPWEVDSPIDGVVISGNATADGWMDKAYPWKTTIDVSALQPGTYTFTARVDDDSDNEGTRPPEATITFTIK